MKCINSKKNIVKIVANNNDLIVQEKNHLYINDLKVDIQEDDYIGVSYGNIIKTNSDKKEVSIWNNTNFLLLSKEHSSLNFINNSLFVLVDFDYENVYSLYKIKVNDNIYNVKIEGFKNIIHFDSEKIWVNDMFENNIIDCISINNENLWSYSLPEGFKIFGQVQMIDNLLILYAVDNNFDHSKTIALDINSGNIKWELDNTIFCQIDDEKKRLLGYAIRKYEVIDPFSGKIIVQKSMMDYYEKGLSPVSPSNTIANGKLWFVSGRGENAKFGRINIETSQVDFIQDFPLQNNGQLSKPVFHNGKLYLLDSNNTLHIFEEKIL